MKTCAGRHHVWNAAGTACRKCNAPKGKPGRPPGPARTKSKAGEAVAGRLAATLGVAAPPPLSDGPFGTARLETAAADGTPNLQAAPPTPTPGTPPPTSAAPPAEVPAAHGWCKQAGKRLGQLFTAATGAAIEKLGREPNEPDDEDQDAFDEAMGQQLAIWFPDAAMTPAKQLLLSGSFIAGAMWVGAKKIPKEAPRLAGAKNGTTSDVLAAPSTSPETPSRAS